MAARVTHDLVRWQPQWGLQLTAAYEFKRFDFQDFTDLRTGAPYAHNAHVLQIHVSSSF